MNRSVDSLQQDRSRIQTLRRKPQQIMDQYITYNWKQNMKIYQPSYWLPAVNTVNI